MRHPYLCLNVCLQLQNNVILSHYNSTGVVLTTVQLEYIA